MEYTTLRNGVQIPMLGYGTYQIPAEDTKRCVLEALSVGYGGYATEETLSDGAPWRETSSVRRHALKSSVDFVYRTFKSHVAEARNMALPDVERLAAGRVWTGRQALDLGLVEDDCLDCRLHDLAGLVKHSRP